MTREEDLETRDLRLHPDTLARLEDVAQKLEDVVDRAERMLGITDDE